MPLHTTSGVRTQCALAALAATIRRRWADAGFFAAACTVAALAVESFTAPILFTDSMLWAAAVWAILLARSEESVERTPKSALRVWLFVLLHVALIAAGFWLELRGAAMGTWGMRLKAGAKVAALLPTLVLLPLPAWRQLFRHHCTETVAALIVAFTYFPWRIFEWGWSWYAPAVGWLALQPARLFVPGAHLVPGPNPALAGPGLIVEIAQACSGMSGVHLFQILFGLAALWEWKRWKKSRILAGYVVGLAAMLAANVLRVALMVIIGNRLWKGPVMRYHGDAAWFYFALVFACLLVLGYDWLAAEKRDSSPAPEACASTRHSTRG